MMYIPLTRGQEAIIDDIDWEKVFAYKWCADKGGNTWYAHCKRQSKNNIRKIYMHRLILNAKDKEKVDHINGNGLDNRRKNLRICTHRNNIRNQNLRKDNTSGFKGVDFRNEKRRKKWRANIVVDSRRIYLGHFLTKEQAHISYEKAAKRYFGEYRRDR